MALTPAGKIRVNVTGARGASDYQVWLSNGNSGTYNDYLNYLAQRVVAYAPGFKGDKGDPGGNVLSNGTSDTASGRTVPVGADLTIASGKAATGDAGTGAEFAYDATVNAAYVANRPGWAIVDSAGRGFRRVIQSDVQREKMRAKLSSSAMGALSGDCTVVVLSNSFGQDDGTTPATILNYFAHHLPRAIINSSRGGSRYHGMLNVANFGPMYNVTAYNGAPGVTIVNAGMFGNQWQMSDVAIAFNGVTADYVDILFDASNSTAGSVIKVRVNGTDAPVQSGQSATVSGSGRQRIRFVFATRTTLTDTISFGCSGSVRFVASPRPGKTTALTGPDVWLGAKSGYAITNYNTADAMDEIAFYANSRAAPKQVVALQLLTNEMYGPDAVNLTPAECVTNFEAFRAGMASRLGANFGGLIVAIAPQANEANFPIKKTGRLYADYARAMEAWAAVHVDDVSLIFQDDTALSGGLYRDAGLHYNSKGNAVLTGTWTRATGLCNDFSNEA